MLMLVASKDDEPYMYFVGKMEENNDGGMMVKENNDGGRKQ